MAKHKLTRDHNGNKKGDSVDLTPEQENYYRLVGLIADEKETAKKEPSKPSKTAKK